MYRAIAKTKGTVGRENLEQFQDFTQKFGQDG